MSLLSLQNITVEFNNKTIIHNFNMDIRKGDKVAIKGDSGAGKSTLLRVLMGLLIPVNGQILFEDKIISKLNIRLLRNNISWLPQNVNIAEEDVMEFMMLPFTYKQNRSINPTKDQIDKLLKIFNLTEDIYNRKMSEASIGEKQRLLLIRGLLLNRPILVLDEPTASLDASVKKNIIEFLFSKPDLTIISASHDEEWVKECNKIFEFKK